MKLRFIIATALVLCVTGSCNSGKTSGKAADGTDSTSVATPVRDVKSLTPSKATVDSVSYLLGINFGSIIKGYDFGDVNMAKVRQGINDFINAEGDTNDPGFTEQFRIDPNEMNDLFNTYLANRREIKLLQNSEKEAAFLAKNKAKDGVTETETGLQYSILIPGDDTKPTDNRDTVWVKYTGTLPDGSVFDQSQDDSVRFTLNRVISGWAEGLKLIGQGGHAIFVIPSKLAYGERGNQGIEPNTPLTFDVTLCTVKPFVEAEKEKE